MALKIAFLDPHTRRTYLQLLQWACPYWWRMLLAFLCSAAATALLALTLSLLKPITDNVIIPLAQDSSQEDERSYGDLLWEADPALADRLPSGKLSSEWHDAFQQQGVELPENAEIQPESQNSWSLTAESNHEMLDFRLWLNDGQLGVYGPPRPPWETNIYIYMLLIPVLFGSHGLATFGSRILFAWVGNRLVIDVQNRVYRHLLAHSLAFYDRARRGDLISRMSNDVSVLAGSIQRITSDLVNNLFQTLGLLGVLLWQDWKLALVTLLMAPAVAIPMQALSRRVRKTSMAMMEKRGDINSVLVETLQGIETVKAFNMEEYEGGRFQTENRRLFRRLMRVNIARALATPINYLAVALCIAAVIYVAFWRIKSGAATVGGIAFFTACLAELVKPLDKLANSNLILQESMQAAHRIFAILDEPPAVQDAPDAIPAPPIRNRVMFQGVTFQYENTERPALVDFNLEVPAGTMVAFVGPSGAGKSTVVRLLSRSYELQQGSLSIDGLDIRRMTLKSLMAQLGVITQRTVIFNDTVRSNIAYGRSDIPQEQIEAAARTAYAHDFIVNLPQGYDTQLGDMGSKISGGQAQRIAIARALLKNPAILILDEATSALDSESEQAIQAALEKLLRNRTTFAIAHRLSTIQKADQIVVLDQGQIVEVGTHTDLYAQGGLYRRLCDIQFQTT